MTARADQLHAVTLLAFACVALLVVTLHDGLAHKPCRGQTVLNLISCFHN